ncbi:hypothetical protein MTO96_012920 [Rhipicephalus appendiculatus]
MGRLSTFAAIALVVWCATSSTDATPPPLLAGLATLPSPGLAAVLIGGKLLAAKAVVGIGGAKLIKASLIAPILTKKAVKPLLGLAAKTAPLAKVGKLGTLGKLGKLGKFGKHGKYVPVPIPVAPPQVYAVPTVYKTTVVKSPPVEKWPSEWPSSAWPASSGWEWPSASPSFGASAGFAGSAYGDLSYAGGLSSAKAPTYSFDSLVAAPQFQAASAATASKAVPEFYSRYAETVKQAVPFNRGSFDFGKSFAAKPALTGLNYGASTGFSAAAGQGGAWAFPDAAASAWPAAYNSKSALALGPTVKL